MMIPNSGGRKTLVGSKQWWESCVNCAHHHWDLCLECAHNNGSSRHNSQWWWAQFRHDWKGFTKVVGAIWSEFQAKAHSYSSAPTLTDAPHRLSQNANAKPTTTISDPLPLLSSPPLPPLTHASSPHLPLVVAQHPHAAGTALHLGMHLATASPHHRPP